MGTKIIFYEPTVSSIVEAAKHGDGDCLFVRLSNDSVSLFSRYAESAVVVVENNIQLARKVSEKMNASVVVAEKRWFSNFIYRHLIEPRVKDELRKTWYDEYMVSLRAEYTTLSMCQRVSHTTVPKMVGSFAFVVISNLPAGEVANLVYEKHRMPTFVASMRDVGISWFAIASNHALFELGRKMSKLGYVELTGANFMSGFLWTYPESPKVYVELLEDIVKDIPAKPPSHLHPTATVEAARNARNFYEYLKLKARALSWSTPKTMINGNTYMVVYCGQNSPHYFTTLKEDTCIVTFYLPPIPKVVVSLPSSQESVSVCVDDECWCARKIVSTPNSALYELPGEVINMIKGVLKKRLSVTLAVSRNECTQQDHRSHSSSG